LVSVAGFEPAIPAL